MTSGDERPRWRRVADWSVRLGLPLAVLAVVLAVFLGEQLSIEHELRLVAPDAAAPGDDVPLRALVFDGIGALSGVSLTSAEVVVRLRTGDGALVSEAVLRPSAAGDSEGSLEVPADARGPLVLEAVASIDGRAAASVRRRLEITTERDELAQPLLGRPAGALQQLAPGSVEAIAGALPPSPFAVRVVGGACVPEAPCTLLVSVGHPAASVTALPSNDVTRLAEDAPPAPAEAPETSGLVAVRVVVHGPEGTVTLEARRGGAAVARREVRLPVALATPGLDLSATGGGAPRLAVSVLGEPPALIVDAFSEGRWARTGSVPRTSSPFELPFALEPGLWRLQVRTDVFSAERAAVRFVWTGGDAAAGLQAIERLGGEPAPPGPEALRSSWASATLEESVRTVPVSIGGYEEDLARLAARRAKLRVGALAGMALGLLVLVVVFLRSGVDAALVAQRVMDATGDPELTSARHRRRTLLSALAIVATVLLAFLAAATLIIARAHLLE